MTATTEAKELRTYVNGEFRFDYEPSPLELLAERLAKNLGRLKSPKIVSGLLQTRSPLRFDGSADHNYYTQLLRILDSKSHSNLSYFKITNSSGPINDSDFLSESFDFDKVNIEEFIEANVGELKLRIYGGVKRNNFSLTLTHSHEHFNGKGRRLPNFDFPVFYRDISANKIDTLYTTVSFLLDS